jgi:hypothetical protein
LIDTPLPAFLFRSPSADEEEEEEEEEDCDGGAFWS